MYISISHSVSLWQYLLNVHIKYDEGIVFLSSSSTFPHLTISQDFQGCNVNILFGNHSQILSMRRLKWKSNKEHWGYHYYINSIRYSLSSALRLHSFSCESNIILPGLLKGGFSQNQGQMDFLPFYQLLRTGAFCLFPVGTSLPEFHFSRSSSIFFFFSYMASLVFIVSSP